LDGIWDDGCQADIDDNESENNLITITGSSFSATSGIWVDSLDCSGQSDITLVLNGNLTLDDEVTATFDSSEVTATRVDIVVNSAFATVNNPAVLSNINALTT
jgi:hypothetical protein